LFNVPQHFVDDLKQLLQEIMGQQHEVIAHKILFRQM